MGLKKFQTKGGEPHPIGGMRSRVFPLEKVLHGEDEVDGQPDNWPSKFGGVYVDLEEVAAIFKANQLQWQAGY